ncbi:MAG TPA: hypothetical protein PKH58_09250 [Paludibacteraceae bacterium]|nr:hypothetical protein [Paludibacteraceae bacterium]
MKKTTFTLLCLIIIFCYNNKIIAQVQSDSTSATLEETLSWIKSKVDGKKYNISYEYVSCTDNKSKIVSTTTIKTLILFSYDIKNLSFTVTSKYTTIWSTSDSITQPNSFTLYLSDINAMSLVCFKDTVYRETREYENTDQKGNEKQICDITNNMYRYCSMYFRANNQKFEMIIPDEFIYDRLLKAFNHAVDLVKKTEKF